MKHSVDTLHRFSCENCGNEFTIINYEAIQPRVSVVCPFCQGNMMSPQEVDHSTTIIDISKVNPDLLKQIKLWMSNYHHEEYWYANKPRSTNSEEENPKMLDGRLQEEPSDF